MVTSLLRPYVLRVTEYAKDVGQGANAPIPSATRAGTQFAGTSHAYAW